jgi:hypothetical protein
MRSRTQENRYGNACENLSGQRRPVPLSLAQPRGSRLQDLDASGGFLGRWDHRLQRPSIRAGTSARHPILSASFDDCWKAQRRQPHLYDGVLRRPGFFSGCLHQHPDRGVTPHQPSAYPALSTAPAGITPVSRKRQSAMSNLRATATIPIRRKRFPPLPKRSRNQTLRALSG